MWLVGSMVWRFRATTTTTTTVVATAAVVSGSGVDSQCIVHVATHQEAAILQVCPSEESGMRIASGAFNHAQI